MDLRRTGSKDVLLFFQSESLTITLKGPASHPDYPGVQHDKKEAALRVNCREDFSISLSGEAGTVSSICTGIVYMAEYAICPVFFEQQQYELFVEPRRGHTVAFWHDNYSIRNQVSPVGREQRMLSGVINFTNNIGYSDLVFMIDGRDYLTITLEVFPSKLSYKEDYLALVSDVTAEVYNLVFDFLKKTYSSFDTNESTQSSPVEFFAIIQHIFTGFVGAADMMLQSPHHQLQQEREVLPQHKIKQQGAETIKWLQKHPDQVQRKGDHMLVARAMTTRKYVTYDTRENRLAKYMLEHTAKRLEQFRDLYRRIKFEQGPDEAAIEWMNEMIRGIQRRCHTGFMKDVNAAAAESGMSLVFGMAPGYRELYRYYLMLQHGLAITGSIFNLSVKDLAVLYEYWCFIKLNSLLKGRKYRLVSQDVIQLNGTGLSVALVKGKGSEVRYIDDNNGDQILLSYNPSERQMPTVNQRPDNVLSLKKQGSRIRYEYVFDAKYKMDPALPDTEYYKFVSKLPGPKVDDINTMHRYRDAIVSAEGADARYERNMFGAYVLFPYANEAEYRQHRFYKSIDTVNIGGLPFLPTATSLVSEMLDSLIDESSDSVLDRAILPKGIEARLQKTVWDKKDVMIGMLRNKEQLDICINHMFYHMPAVNLPEDKLPVKYVALYQSQKDFGTEAQIAYYGEVKRIQKVKRKEITEVPFPAYRGEEDYYRVEIKQWRKLARPIRIGRGIRYAAFTNEFLFRHAEKTEELFIKTEAEYRFYTEMKRFVRDANVLNDGVEAVSGFEFENRKVIFRDGWIYLTHQGKILMSCTVKDFARRPGAECRRMMKYVERGESHHE